MISPVAVFDTLYIGSKLQEKLSDFSNYEIQLFCYLSCLLSLYEGNPISFWGYKFIKNDLGSPYSMELNDSIEVLITKDALKVSTDNFIEVTEAGEMELKLYSQFHSNKARIPYLEAACQSIKLLPYGLVKDSIIREPMLKYANQHTSKRLLADNESPAFTLLYEQFEMLKTALENKYGNLIIPAIVWLEYLGEHKSVDASK